jgi:ketosteroid isomerase-like protein
MIMILIKKYLPFMLAFVCLTVYGQKETYEDQIKSLQARYDLAIEQKDSVFLHQLFHPKMVITGGDGSRRNAKAEIKDCVDPNYNVVYFKTSNIEVDVFNETAILRGDIEWELKQGTRSMKLQRRITFTYAHMKKQWVLVAQHIGMPPK